MVPKISVEALEINFDMPSIAYWLSPCEDTGFLKIKHMISPCARCPAKGRNNDARMVLNVVEILREIITHGCGHRDSIIKISDPVPFAINSNS